MALQNYIVSVIGNLLIMASCYLVGCHQLSFGWIFVFLSLHVLKTYMWRNREKRLMALRQTALKEREVILAQLQDLPAWVQFPDTERVEWLNKVVFANLLMTVDILKKKIEHFLQVILQLWPYIGEYSKFFMREYIEPQVKSQLPAIFRSFKFTKMDVGDIPCRVGGIKVYTHNVGRDRIIVDMDIAYAGDADFDVSVAGFTGGLNQLQFSGKLRAVLKPLLPYPPMIGGISGFFLEKPKFDFNLTGMGEFVELPGLLNAIRAIIDSQARITCTFHILVSALCVLPNEVVVSLVPDIDVTQLYFPEPDGVLRLKVVEARNLENRDIKFTKNMASDPYCEIQVGSQFNKTRVIDNDLNPVWNEYFEFVVDQADGQKLRMELFDYDTASSDEELGRLEIDLINVKRLGYIDDWFPLDACKHGEIRIQATWMNLSSSFRDLASVNDQSQWIGADKPVHPALLMVFIDSISNLPYPKANLEPSPYVMIRLGKDVQQTPVKLKTVNPLFQSKFLFFVRYPERQELEFEAIDSITKRSLGEFALPLKLILQERNLEISQQTFILTQGVHQSPIVVTARIRALINDQQKNSISSDDSAVREADYANEVFIERAEKSTEASEGEHHSTISGSNERKSSKAVEAGTAFVLKPKLPLNELMVLRRNSNESTESVCRRRRTLGERLFSPKHTQSREKIVGRNGRLHFALRHMQVSNKLTVRIMRVTDLLPLDTQGSADPYITLRLTTLGNIRVGEKRRTSVIERCLDPVFDVEFEFDVHSSDIKNHVLIFTVKDATNYGIFSKAPILGMAEVRLDNVDINDEFSNFWYDLEA